MKTHTQKGSALIFALIFLLVLSVSAASLMFLAQSETWSGTNYKMMTQTRYGAEAGLNAAANYIMFTYVPPTSMTGFDTSNYPLKDTGGANVVLTSISGQTSNYPNTAVVTAFNTATNSHAAGTSLTAGLNTIDYTASAQLLSMTKLTPFGSTTPTMIQTWKITAHGDMGGIRSGEAEVTAIMEREIAPAFPYAAFADNNGCGSLSFNGNGSTDSYDSSALSLNAAGAATTTPTFQSYGGNLGTNGNQTDSGNNVQINGSLSTPRTGVGACTSGNVTALTGSTTQITGGIIELPQAITFQPPVIPAPGTTNISSTATLCPTSAAVTVACPTPGEYKDINLSGNDTLSLPPGTYNINSISLSGNSTLQIVPDPVTGKYGPVVINVSGNGNSSPLQLTGNGFSNPTYDPSNLQFVYAGTGTIKVAGNGASAAVVYAPNATVDFNGNGAFYGAVVANTVLDVGNGSIHYDRRLQKKLFTVGNYMLNSFNWSRF
jgi:Tfp pilus assembly protein PilX